MIESMTERWEAAARPGSRLGHRVEAHEAIGSTNDRARILLDGDRGEGIVVVAELQTAGRGRMGRSWTSPAGANLTASVALRPRLEADAAWMLVPAAALAARAACAAHAPVGLKWPNDLVDGEGRKLGGLLVEVASEADRVRHAVVGVGINVNWRRAEMPAELRETATSLLELAGAAVDRPRLLAALCAALETELAAIEAGASPLPRYRQACATLGADVLVETPGGRIEGRALDVDERGALLVATENGTLPIATGDVVRVRAMRS